LARDDHDERARPEAGGVPETRAAEGADHPVRPARRRPRRGRGRRHDLAGRFRRVEQELATLARNQFGRMFGQAFDQAEAFDLDLRFTVHTDGRWRLEGAPLEAQVRDQVREMASRAEALRYGRVYCHRCQSSGCGHGHPPSPRAVFGGFSSTGQPEWVELPQLLLDLGHGRVEELYERPPALLAARLTGDELKARQLNEFGRQSKAYDVLAQVVAGYVRLPAPEHGEAERVALTVQAVEARRLDGRPWLALNVIGGRAADGPLTDLLDGQYFRLHEMLRKARAELRAAAVARRRGRGRVGLGPEIGAKAEQVLLELARSIERHGRQTGRRTRHAEARGRSAQRPTSKALEDAHAAPEHRVLWDARDETVVVLGQRNRVHVFTLRAKAVTSLTLEPADVDRRRRTGRWVTPEPEQLRTFRESLERRG